MTKQFSIRSFARSFTARMLLVLTLGAFTAMALLYQSLCEADRGFALAYAFSALLPMGLSTHLAVHSSFQNQLLVKLNNQMEGMQSDLEFSNNRLRRQAETDMLTGLKNRRFFFQAAQEMIAVSGPKTVLALDVDYFKIVNDTYGHETGDRALSLIAKTIADIVGPTHLAARIGGEEFAVFLNNIGPELAYQIAERIRKDIEQLQFKADFGSFHPLSISIGICNNGTRMNVQGLLRNADMALLQAKRQGRNQSVIFVPKQIESLNRVINQ